jgi:hypothetical protein
MPQGSTKPRVVEIPRPVRMGKLPMLAETATPPLGEASVLAGGEKGKTICFFRSSPVSSVLPSPPSVRSFWNRGIAAREASSAALMAFLVAAGAAGAAAEDAVG